MPSVYVCTQLTSGTSSGVSSGTATCTQGSWVQVPPPLALDKSGFGALAGVTAFVILAAFAVRLTLRMIGVR